MTSRGEHELTVESCAAALPLVVVTLPAALLPLFPGCARRVELRAATVGNAIDALNESWPGMRDRICDSSPDPPPHQHLRRGRACGVANPADGRCRSADHDSDQRRLVNDLLSSR